MRCVSYVIVACLLSAGLCFIPGEATASSVGWQPAVWLQNEYNYEQDESMGIDDYGNVMIVWEEPFSNYSNSGIFAVRYDALSGWEEAEMIWQGSFWCGYTTMAMSPSGDAVAVWYTDDQYGNAVLMSSMYSEESGWEESTIIDVREYGSFMAASMDAEGHAVVVWTELQTVYGAIYSPGTGWEEGELLDSGGVWPSVEFDRLGNAIAIWDDYPSYQVESKRYEPGTGWGPTEVVSGAVGGYWAEIDVNDTGYALCSWFMHNGTAWEMFANLYAPGAGWGTPEMTGPTDGGWHPFGGAVSAGSEGEFFVIWSQTDSYDHPYNKSVLSMRWVDGAGWEEPSLLNSGLATNSDMFTEISANTAGQAVATWTEGNDTHTDIMACMYTPGVGWDAAENIGSDSGETTWLSMASLAPNGNAILIYRQYAGADSHLWGREYYALERPDLTVTSPIDGTVTDEPFVEVAGTTDPGATVTVNGTEATVGVDGSFSATFSLTNGLNEILVVATIEGQGSAGVLIEVTFNDPVVELLAQIDQLMDEIEALTTLVDEQQLALELYEAILDQLEETNHLLNESREESAAMEDDISAFEEEVSSLEDCVADLEDNVTELESTIAEQEDEASAARTLQYVLVGVIAALALVVVALLAQNSKLKKGRGPQGPG